MNNQDDGRKYAAATQRNRAAILPGLLKYLAPEGDILEIASGTGEHAVFFAPHFSPRQWIPSEPDSLLRSSIVAWQRHYSNFKFHPPLIIDARAERWIVEESSYNISSIVNINMIHIAPWEACEGLIAGAARILDLQGVLYLYGPFKIEGKHTAASNEAFDQMLQAENPQWGVRELEVVNELAQTKGFNLTQVIAMPANNLGVVWKKG